MLLIIPTLSLFYIYEPALANKRPTLAGRHWHINDKGACCLKRSLLQEEGPLQTVHISRKYLKYRHPGAILARAGIRLWTNSAEEEGGCRKKKNHNTGNANDRAFAAKCIILLAVS